MNLRSKLNRFQLNHIGLLSFVMCFCCQLTALEYKEQRSQKVLLSEGFETSLNQGVGRDILANRWIELSSSNAASGSAALKVLYKGDARGSKRVIVNSPFARSERAKLSFSVRFCPGFDFAKGGKMHGLGPAKPAAGGKKGGPEQWSARLMWRKNGGLMTYVYHQDMKKNMVKLV